MYFCLFSVRSYIFLEAFSFFLFSLFMCIFDCKCKNLNRHPPAFETNKTTHNNKTNNLREKKNIRTNIQLIQAEPERYLFAVEWWAGGCPIFLFVCFSRRFIFVVCLFLLSLFEFLHV